MEATVFTPVFISNSPAGQDLFEEKAQHRLTQSIVSLIGNENANIRIIGLEGPWGSGKSNVINMVGGELKETHYLFIHDAWGHQEDLQRRAFLEELTEYLCAHDLLKNNIWDKKLKDHFLKNRKR